MVISENLLRLVQCILNALLFRFVRRIAEISDKFLQSLGIIDTILVCSGMHVLFTSLFACCCLRMRAEPRSIFCGVSVFL